ncbi:reverse transcriptase [Gossypium australe]|uniref:Reverse transcriptase n=1 Tax=Gossypium australe TaxID=47621 RepID=A0A5B6VJX6_9ROSI|nr:reverse transcriptase [Gossypium australe]
MAGASISGKTIEDSKRRLTHENKVSELIRDNRDGWKEDRILELFRESMRDQICKIPILHKNHDDQRVWFHNPWGFYSTKTTYSWLILKKVGFGPHKIFWRVIWKLKTLPKIRIFCWKLVHDILPTYIKIASIREGFNSVCLRCGNERETLIHVMKDCPKARAVLEHGGFNNRLLDENFTRCIDWLEEAMRVLDRTAAADFVTVLWNI